MACSFFAHRGKLKVDSEARVHAVGGQQHPGGGEGVDFACVHTMLRACFFSLICACALDKLVCARYNKRKFKTILYILFIFFKTTKMTKYHS